MDAQKQNIRSCKNCRYYDAFYIKCAYTFDKHKAGYCTQKQKAVYKNDVCGLYKYSPQKEKTVTVEHLDIAIRDLEELIQIFFNCDY